MMRYSSKIAAIFLIVSAFLLAVEAAPRFIRIT